MWELLLDNSIRRVVGFCLLYKSLLKLFLLEIRRLLVTGLQVLGSSELMKQMNPILRISIMCLVSNENKTIYLAAVHSRECL